MYLNWNIKNQMIFWNINWQTIISRTIYDSLVSPCVYQDFLKKRTEKNIFLVGLDKRTNNIALICNRFFSKSVYSSFQNQNKFQSFFVSPKTFFTSEQKRNSWPRLFCSFRGKKMKISERINIQYFMFKLKIPQELI